MAYHNLHVNYFSVTIEIVKLGSVKSEWENVYKGAARGSLMDPQSYNVFTNDMLFILENNVDVYNYADDNTFVCSGLWLWICQG